MKLLSNSLIKLLQPSFLLVLYIFTISIFAVYYTYFCFHEFYFSTSNIDKENQNVKKILKIRLQEYFKKDFNDLLKLNGSLWSSGEVVVDDLKVGDYFEIHLKFKVANKSIKNYHFNFTIKLSAEVEESIEYKMNELRTTRRLNYPKDSFYLRRIEDYEIKRLFSGDEKVDFPITQLVPVRFWGANDKGIMLPMQLSDEIDYFIAGSKGFADNIEGKFAKMLYFSTVTITTTGYGDIVPISNRTRAAVGIEVFLGSLIFGMFLWSLTQKIKRE